MSDKKFCDYCGAVVSGEVLEEHLYYTIKISCFENSSLAGTEKEQDICKECYKKGVIVREDK